MSDVATGRSIDEVVDFIRSAVPEEGMTLRVVLEKLASFAASRRLSNDDLSSVVDQHESRELLSKLVKNHVLCFRKRDQRYVKCAPFLQTQP